VLILILAVPTAIYFWYFKDLEDTRTRLKWAVAIAMLAYAFVYFAATYFIHILAASVSLWLVQFLIPLAILKIGRDPLSTINFRWSAVFSKPIPLLIAAAFVTGPLLFVVRDSEQILPMFGSWRAGVFLPLSILYMVAIVAFWEEFFFRGVLMSSIQDLSKSAAAAVFFSALLFGTYHVPMRYFNSRSPYFGDLLSSIAATINEQFILGLFLGLIVYKSRNLWHGIWLHAVVNGVSFMYQLSQMLKIG
jgi:membrane protease YdiL (CAAX protease family)